MKLPLVCGSNGVVPSQGLSPPGRTNHCKESGIAGNATERGIGPPIANRSMRSFPQRAQASYATTADMREVKRPITMQWSMETALGS
jgi:hypothetical protein